MQLETLKSTFIAHKEQSLFGRYITNNHIEPLVKKMAEYFEVNQIGLSVKHLPIYSMTVGSGEKKIFMWSQMHGNESTTTKAIFDLLNVLQSDQRYKSILEACTICIIPILNPDGANAYTRFNANEVDLNRDAQTLSQPESVILRKVFDDFKPDYCFNLHGQRTIFSAGNTSNSATVSFLSPSQDENCTITQNRTVAMEIISVMNQNLQEQIPNQVGRYDDAFNLNCVGDTFQSLNVPTILFEAGHFPNDYNREIVREYIFQSYLIALSAISKTNIKGPNYKGYFKIPENEKNFFDIIIKNVKANTSDKNLIDIGVRYREELIDGKIEFIPKIEKIEKLGNYFGHNIIDALGHDVKTIEGSAILEGYENDFVLINREYFSLKVKLNVNNIDIYH